MIVEFPTDSPEALAAIASTPEPKLVWINGSQTYILTGDDYDPPPMLQ